MESILKASSSIPLPNRFIGYGTAGFRTLATDLPMVFFRAALVALLRAHETQKFIGIMVTVSHNAIPDNGLKMIDYNGEMLPRSWEKIAEEIANAPSLEDSLQSLWPSSLHSTILIGADNRPSSPELVSYIKSAITAAGCSYHDYSTVTTPQLHYLVRESNKISEIAPISAYISQLKSKADRLFSSFPGGPLYENDMNLDCAGGVGAGIMRELGFDWIHLYNTDPCDLNRNCGAEYAHKERKLPINLESSNANKKCASFDGDADRVVYYYSRDELEVLGGERLTVLYAAALNKLMKDEGATGKITVVTTGYSNSASIRYLEDQGIQSIIVPTGVKYLHEEAHKHEISIYFEANGHGTVLHQSHKIEEFRAIGAENCINFLTLANTAVGDAAADLLLAEVSLRILDWSLHHWAELYSDLPNIMIAIRTQLKDRIKNSWDQLEILEPEDLSGQVKEIISRYSEYNARTLVRPSGTEPIVRVYVEANSIDICREISAEIVKVFEQYN